MPDERQSTGHYIRALLGLAMMMAAVLALALLV